MPDLVSWILPFLFVLTVVVTIHELGHFWMARAFGTMIDSFSIGFGKAIFKWRDKQGVEWRIGWIPLGGYVRFAGDDNAASTVPDQDDLDQMKAKILAVNDPSAVSKFYHFKPVWQRAAIAAAGPLANFVLAAVLFAFLAGAVGEPRIKPVIGQIQAGSVAEQAGFKVGDEIRALDGRPVNNFFQVAQYVSMRGNDQISFQIARDGREMTLLATPRLVIQEDKIGGRQKIGRIGFGSTSDYELVKATGPIDAVASGVKKTWSVLAMTVDYLGRLLTGKVSPDQISGVIGIAKVSDGVAKASFETARSPMEGSLNLSVNMIQLIALISVSIGFLNLLPIPVLDGGHLLFYAYEAVARRPLAASVQAVGYRLGLALLLGFMLFAGWNDLQRYNVFNFLGGLFS